MTADQPGDEGLHYFVQILACDLESGKATVLAADHQRLIYNLQIYTVELEFPTPEIGRYQLVGMVLLPNKDKVGVTLGDVLTVVP